MSTIRAWMTVLPILAGGAAALGQQRFEDRLPEHVVLERDLEYGKAGERSLKLDLLRPRDTSGGPRPVVVYIHGGGWESGDKSSGLPRLLPFVSSGDYVGVTIDYRLSSEAGLPARIEDCQAAIRWLKDHAGAHGIDPERIGVWGNSAGGHLASLLGTSAYAGEGGTRARGSSSGVACVVSYCAPSDLAALGDDNPNMAKVDSPLGRLLGGPLAEKIDAARAASPITYVSPDDPPFLVVHGTMDSLVPIAQSERFVAALRQAGVDVTFIRMEGGGHSIGGAEITSRVSAFFDKHLRGQHIEVSEEPIKVAARSPGLPGLVWQRTVAPAGTVSRLSPN